MKKIFVLPLALVLITAFSCKQVKKEAEEAKEEVEAVVEDMEPTIVLEKLDGSPAYADAELVLNAPANTTIAESGKSILTLL